MNFRRALFIAAPGQDPASPLAVLRRVAPRLEHLSLLLPALDSAALEQLRAAARGAAPSVDAEQQAALDGAALVQRCIAGELDLLVFAARSLRSVVGVAARRGRWPVSVLWADGQGDSHPITHLACVAPDARAKAAVEAFLRDHADADMHLALLTPTAVPPDAIDGARQIMGIGATVEVSSPADAPSLRRWLAEWARDRRIDLLVCAQLPTAVLAGALRTVPTLLVPPVSPARPRGRPSLDLADVIDDGGPLRMRIDVHVAPGRFTPTPDDTSFAFVAEGRVVATARTHTGEVEVPAGLAASWLGVARNDTLHRDPVSGVEQRVSIVRRGTRPLVLFDAELPAPALAALARSRSLAAADPVAVRMRPTRSCGAHRERLRAAGLPAVVLDARAVLAEGDAFDVFELLDAVRLARVASRLRAGGFTVAALVHRGPTPPALEGFASYAAQDVAELTIPAEPLSLPVPPTATVGGNRVELELDNALARRWLLEAIAGARETLHFQVYIAADDDVGGTVEAALAAAGARGVRVRALVDSLYGLHGSYGTQNPLLARLGTRPGVELRVGRPLSGLPSLVDLKQRDHRKLALADGRIALIGGRNLSHEYYTGFTEAELTPVSRWRQVPWLDAGARVEGPAVAILQESFRSAWREAGGDDFPVVVPPAAGTTVAGVVVHHGLRDARTLEAYRALIDGARSHIAVVNGFPLVLELQHALVRALRRGIRVRALTGVLSPTHEGTPFTGSISTVRAAATEFVRSRLDPIVAAGGEIYVFARRDVPGWATELGLVHTHVHAKALSVDGRVCAVGSANVDITASYWESEAMLIVEDAELVRGFEAEIDELMTASTRVDREDPTWQRLAEGRAWMRHWPGVLTI